MNIIKICVLLMGLLISAEFALAGTVGYVDITNTTPTYGAVTRSPAGTLVSTSGNTSSFSFPKNAPAVLTATPNSGYQVSGTVDCGVTNVTSSTASSCSYNITDGTTNTFSVTFELVPVQYTITATAGAGGTASPASQTVGSGGSVTVSVVPNSGYAIQSITINGGANQLSQPSFSAVTQMVSSVTADTTVTATFIQYHVITVTQPANCSILYNGVQPVGGVVKVLSGQTAAFTIAPGTGATIDDVLYDSASVGAVASYTTSTVSADHALTASCSLPTSDINKYTITPPIVNANIQPNLLLLIDNSASMYDMAHDSTGKCYDNTFSSSGSYEGYFDTTATYSFNSTNSRFEPGASMPSACTFKAADFCVQMSNDATIKGSNLTNAEKVARTITNFVATGKFLNWLAASKLDLQKKILTGGKYDTVAGTLLSESRGCMGRRFVRIVSNSLKSTTSVEDLTGVTFAIRGPVSSEGDYINPATQGGSTRIEIYDAAYNVTSCSAAIIDWSTVTSTNMGTVQGDTSACLGCASGSCNTSSTLKAEAYTHMTHQCYWYYNNHDFANSNTITTDCDNIYSTIYGNNPANITNELAGDAVCSSVINHAVYRTGATDSGIDKGYIGRCVTIGGGGGGHNSWDAACLDREFTDFCAGMAQSDVTDPSGTGVSTGSSTSMPSFIIDAGVNALGTMKGTYFANVKQATSPSSLIQEFRDYIRFGAMIFNVDGSGSECDGSGTNIKCAKHCSTTTTKACFVSADCPTGESCNLNTKTDGGKIVSYIGYDPVGDHSSGLIQKIDEIQATAWTPYAEAYYDAIGYFANRTDLRLQAADFDATKNPSVDRCRLNNILIVSDGGSTADQHPDVTALAGHYNDGDLNTGTCTGYAGSKNLDDLSWLARNKNIKTFSLDGSSSAAPTENNQKIKTYVVYNGIAAANTTDECLPSNLMNETAKNGGTTSAYIANSYTQLMASLRTAFTEVAFAASSGTAASIVNKRNESGANLLTATFYPLRDFGGTDNKAKWLGELQNYWYYYDPYFSFSGLREDSVADNYLRLNQDYYCNMAFDTALNKTRATRYRHDVKANTMTLVDTVDADSLNALWKAGNLLHQRSPGDRTVYTNVTIPTDASIFSASFVDFDPSTTGTNFSTFKNFLRTTDNATAAKWINYVRGSDYSGLRPRTVTVGGTSGVWKLGDIISSTPITQTPGQLNAYDLLYNDSTYTKFINSNNYKKRGMVYLGANDGMFHAFKMGKLTSYTDEYTKAKIENTGDSLAIGSEEWAFVPRNALPYLKYYNDPNYEHLYYVDNTSLLVDASIKKHNDCSTTNYWDCRRQTTLLSGVTDPATDNIDSDRTSWRTIVISGMGLGGASHSSSLGCLSNTTVGGVTYGDCVQSPIPGSGAGSFTGSANVGRSSYFAIDVTNPTSPSLMWEFVPSATMGYAMNDPVVIRVSGKNASNVLDPSTNGRWFAIFTSGPTGPINTATHQFYARSDRPLRIFVVDIATGKLEKTFDLHTTDASITVPAGHVLRSYNAFGSSISTNAIDTDANRKYDTGNYSTDVVYVGYTRPKTSSGWDSGSDGGLLRLVTNDDPDPANWKLGLVIDGTGPVTSSVEKLFDDYDSNSHKPELWLYFGTGRYFYRDNAVDAADEIQAIYGIKDPCYSTFGHSKDMDATCSTYLTKNSDLEDTSLVKSSYANDKKGWYITLKSSAGDYKAERVITTPSVRTSGLLIVNTFSPSTDLCGFGGKSSVRLINYKTGGLPGATALKGKITIQLSTGAIVGIDLSTLVGSPPAVGSDMPGYDVGFGRTQKEKIQDQKPYKPIKKILHILEK